MPARIIGLFAFVVALLGVVIIVGCNLNPPPAESPPSDTMSDQPPPSDGGVEFPAPDPPDDVIGSDNGTPGLVDPVEEFAAEDLLSFVVGVDGKGETLDSVDLRALSVGARIVLSIPDNAPSPTRQLGGGCECLWSVLALDSNDAEPIGVFNPPDACTTTYTVLRVGDALISVSQTCDDGEPVQFSQGISAVAEPADIDDPDSDEEEDEDDELVIVTPGGGDGGGGDGGGGTPPPGPMAALTVAIEGDGGVAVAPVASTEAGADGVTREYAVGTLVTLSAVNSKSGCFFRWGGDVQSNDSPLIVALAADTFVLAEFVDPTAPSRAPTLDAHVTITANTTILLSGSVQTCQNDPADMVEISGPGGTVETAVVDGAFAVDVPLGENRANKLFVTPISVAGVRGAPVATVVTRDSQPPTLFIDFPDDGTELTTDSVDVGGRVSDMLSGFLGLTVTVDGVAAEVDVGIGTNGTFVRPNVPLANLGVKTITVIATDLLGNSFERSVNVTRVEIPADVPKLEVISGSAQSAQIGGLLPEPIIVRVTNGDGTPFANKVVTFDVTRSNGRLTPTGPSAAGMEEGSLMLQVHTDANGFAEASWRVGFDAGCGNNRIEVTSNGIVGTTLFCASATPAPPAQLNIGGGNNQRAEAGGPTPEPLRVWVNDRCNGVSDVPVTFTVLRGGGRVNERISTTINTSATGHAEVDFVLGSDPGNNIVEASFTANPTNAARFVIFGVARDESQPTSFSGIVLNNNEQPIQGATVELTIGGESPPTVQTDGNGLFRFDDVPSSGHAGLHIDGSTATHVGGLVLVGRNYPALHFEPLIVPNAENSLPVPVLLPPLNPTNVSTYTGTEDLELTVEGVEGLRMIVRAGTTVRLPDGTTVGPGQPGSIDLMLNQVLFDKIPMPIPDGAAPPFAWTLQPGGTTFDPPIEIVYPNMSSLPPGSIAYFLSFNHDTMRFEIVATGSVNAEGSYIVSDPGAGITTAGWGCNCPPYSVTEDACSCADCQTCMDGVCTPVPNCDPDDPEPCGGGCGDCQDCVGDGCEPRECGDCMECVNDACQETECGDCMTCVSTECEPDDGAACPFPNEDGQCIEGICQDGECAEPPFAQSRRPVCCEPCTKCQTCEDGECVDNCTEPCQVCLADGTCDSGCSECQSCKDDTCVDACPEPCQVCLSDGTCESKCLECQTCTDDTCVDACPEPCQACLADGTCESFCLECESCVDDVCTEACPGACDTCLQDGSCEDSCAPCFVCDNDQGDCIPVQCDPCEECVVGPDFKGTCQAACDPLNCESCQDGECLTNCDAASCESCNGAGSCMICDPNNCLANCVDGTCESTCNPQDCETCDGAGSCVSTCDASNCETACVDGTCQQGCDPQRCDSCDGNGNCVFECDPNNCENACIDGVCQSACDGTSCETCDGAGNCVSYCDEDNCETTCADGVCLQGCVFTGCSDCDGSGSCVSTCDVNQCETACVDDVCQSACDPQLCEVCDGVGNCVSTCDPNDCEIACVDGVCQSACDDSICEACDGAGNCASFCDLDLCETVCASGTCLPGCDPACEQCDGNGSCVSICDPNNCENACVDGVCQSACDGSRCEVCDGAGSCVSYCDEDNCETTCADGVCLQSCVFIGCSDCDGSGSCVSTCNLNECETTCVNDVCQSACNILDCETCDGAGNCESYCDLNNCETVCNGGFCSSACDPAVCELCNGAGSCVFQCRPNETCVNGACAP